jgi:tetratricopeptide (TPR) repeat protein
LGLIELHEGRAGRAVALLEEALAAAKDLGDAVLNGDIQVNLALAVVLDGSPHRALPLLDHALSVARDSKDRFGEKVALERLGLAHAHLREFRTALAYFERGLAVATAVNDRTHRAELLWHMAIQSAELGRHDWAGSHARAAVDLMQQVGDPRAAVFADHAQKFVAGVVSVGASNSMPVAAGDVAVVNGGVAMPGSARSRGAARGPTLLKMAFRAAKSAGRFVGSGLATVSEPTLQGRLTTCAACEFHTGLRCRLCGCFTNVKARMPHEACPVSKWPV